MAAAPLTDAALTSYHAIKRWLPSLQPGATAVVIGAAARFMVVPWLRPLLATHLASDDAAFLTGAVVPIDGGSLA